MKKERSKNFVAVSMKKEVHTKAKDLQTSMKLATISDVIEKALDYYVKHNAQEL